MKKKTRKTKIANKKTLITKSLEKKTSKRKIKGKKTPF